MSEDDSDLEFRRYLKWVPVIALVFYIFYFVLFGQTKAFFLTVLSGILLTSAVRNIRNLFRTWYILLLALFAAPQVFILFYLDVSGEIDFGAAYIPIAILEYIILHYISRRLEKAFPRRGEADFAKRSTE